MSGRSAKSVDEIRALLEGPVNSIPAVFRADGTVDWGGVANVIEAGIAGGSRVTLLTYGDSQFEFLSHEEIVRLTRMMTERSAGRSLTVAATGRWWARRSIEFARFCRDAGVDVLMVLPGQQSMNAPVEELARYYLSVADIIPVMLVGAPEYALLDLLVDEPRICCFKEDGTEQYAVRTMRRYGGRWKFMTGGQLWRHFTQLPFGCRAFMSPWCCIKPDVNRRYWEGVLNGDFAAVCDVVSTLDAPLFDMAERYPGGWQCVWRAILEIIGIAKRYMREPMPSATDAEMESLKEELGRLGVV